MKTLNRRQAVKTIAVGSAIAATATPAIATTDPDAALIQIEADYLAALQAACDAGTRLDDYGATLPRDITHGPRIQVGQYNGHPRYATDDESVEAKIQEWIAQADEAERADAARDPDTREILHRALDIARERGHLGEILSPEEKRQRALSYRSAWKEIKAAHAEAIAKTDLPRLHAEHDAAWARVREIQWGFVSTPARGMTGVAVKVRYLESLLRDFEYDESAITGRVMASIMRDLNADPLPMI